MVDFFNESHQTDCSLGFVSLMSSSWAALPQVWPKHLKAVLASRPRIFAQVCPSIAHKMRSGKWLKWSSRLMSLSYNLNQQFYLVCHVRSHNMILGQQNDHQTPGRERDRSICHLALFCFALFQVANILWALAKLGVPLDVEGRSCKQRVWKCQIGVCRMPFLSPYSTMQNLVSHAANVESVTWDFRAFYNNTTRPPCVITSRFAWL